MGFDWTKYLANGISTQSGRSVPERKEINDLMPEEMWLYLQGLAKFQAVDIDDPLSYYQIAGIHGLPYQTWPNLPDNRDIPKNPTESTGFCTHSSIIFLTWHRPYLALFESLLYKHVNQVAEGMHSDVQNRSVYIEAARNFRMPYWDWAKKDIPEIFPPQAISTKVPQKDPSFTVAGFSGADHNPLHHYGFDTKRTPNSISLGKETTVRHPNAGAQAVKELIDTVQEFYDAQEDVSKISPGFRPDTNPGSRNLTERVAYILQSYQRFGPMSYNIFRPSRSNPNTANAEIWGSFEDIHNVIHVRTGGTNGHMENPTYAAFDPIFWLHHTEIDRMLAIWQALHQNDIKSDTWVTTQWAGFPTWASPDTLTDPKTGDKDPIESAKSKLYPFRNAQGWYDSNSVKKTTDFGYTYSETATLSSPPTTAQLQGLVSKINAIYPSPGTLISRSSRRIESAGEELLPKAALLRQIADEKVTATHAKGVELAQQLPEQQTLLKRSLEPSKPLLRDLAHDDKFLEYLVNIKAEKHALGGHYSVSVFLGPVEEDDIVLWPLSPHYVGEFSPFGQNAETECPKCKDDQAKQIQITGQIPLTLALMERYLAGILPDMTPDSVVPYLQTNLHWRVVSNGEILDDRSQLAGLKVFVISNEVTVPEDETQLPTYAFNVAIHADVTTKPDGSGRGEGTGLVAGQQ